MKLRHFVAIAVLAFAAPDTAALAQSYEVATRTNVEYVEHDGTKLTGDLYLPKGLEKAPLMIAMHGGGWQAGSPASYRSWGPYLAKNGIGVFAIRYRLSKPGAKSYPQAVYDVKAAVQFVRAQASELGVDPERIGLMGDSAGGHLAALVALAGNEPQFSSEYRTAAHTATPAGVKAVVAFYGVFDMAAQWQHDQVARPADQITEKFLGAPPMKDRRVYFEASPLSYATVDRNRTRFLLVHGTTDDIVDVKTQSEAFLTALKQAGFYVRTVVIPGAGHFWVGADPLDQADSFGAFAAPKVLRFLQSQL